MGGAGLKVLGGWGALCVGDGPVGLNGPPVFFLNSNAPKIYQMNEYFKKFNTITFLAT